VGPARHRRRAARGGAAVAPRDGGLAGRARRRPAACSRTCS
jgi:hypothetical protein